MIATHEIIYGHRAVWINNGSGCLGRFGVHGIDVHRTMEDQMEGMSQCLFCTHGQVTRQDWSRFVDAMHHHHQVDLSGSPMPAWLET